MDGGRPPRGTFAPVPISGRRPPIERWAAIAAVALIIVVAKPWPSTGETDGPAGVSGVGARPTLPAPASAVVPTAGATDAPGSLVAAFCLDTHAWLVASVERTVQHSIDQRIRIWRALDPATGANGPDDPAIPTIPVVSERLTELGWCAPVTGAEKPSQPIDVSVWLRTSGGARTITLDSSRPVSDRSPYGDLYLPPNKGPSSRATAWPNGTYVFRYREADGRERWFAIGVEIRPRPSPAP